MDKLMPYFDLQKVVDYLSKYSFVLRIEYGNVLKRWEENKIPEKYAKSLIIRTLCIRYDSSTYHLMYAILNCSNEAKNAVETLFPEFELFYVRNIFEDRDGIFHVIDQFDNIQEAIHNVMNADNYSKYSINVLFDYIPRYHIAPLFYRITQDPPLNLRNYQLELAESAINGKNTVICAPTGSGKTIIATYIIRDHVIKMRKNGKDPKIAFIVPTGPLVDQQKNVIDKYLGNIVVSRAFRGQDIGMSLEELANGDIFFMTAKVLVNSSNPDAAGNRSFYTALSNFTLIILDEAHHAVKQHPFNELMNIYRYEKYGEGVIALKRMPQIVGMTASLGTSKTKDLDEVKKHIISMCANLDAQTLSRTRHHLDELKQYTSNTQDEVVYIPTNDDDTKEYRRLLCELKDYLEKEIRKIDGISNIYEDILFKDCTDITEVSYIGWVVNCYDNLLPTLTISQVSMKAARYCFKSLETLYWTLKCVKGFPTDETTNVYLKELGNINGNIYEKTVHEYVERISELPVSKCAIFKKLTEIIKEQFETNPDSRIVIFVVMKQYCQLGIESIKKSLNISCSYITGVNSCLQEGGQSIKEQKIALKNFKDGNTPILFATTVADEGIDIARCNLVIKYSLVTDEIAHVQRKGRARQLQSRCFLMTGDEKIVDQENTNKELVTLMEEAHEELNKLTEEEIEMMIRKVIERVNVLRLEEEKKKKALIARMASHSDNYHILCRDCTTVITNSENIKIFNSHYVIADKDIWKKVNSDSLRGNEADYFSKRGFIGNFFCKGLNGLCKHKLGKIITWKGAIIPNISCSKITFGLKENSTISTNRKTFKKWKNVLENLFYPKKSTEADYDLWLNAEDKPTELLPKILELNNDSDIDYDSDE